MKKTLYYGLLTIIALAIYSCQDEETISINDEVTVTGSFSSASARTVYTDGESSVSVAWEAGDLIGLVSASENTVYEYSAASSGSTTDFEPSGSAIKDADGETFYAWYPYTGYYMADSDFYADLPNIFSQTYNPDGMSPEYDFIYSKGVVDNNELSLSFSHLFAFLEITIDPELLDFMGMYISSSDDIAVRTGSYYNFSDGSIVGTTSKALYMNISDEYLEGEDMLTCYVAILPTSSSSYVTIRNLHGTSSSYSIGDVVAQKNSPDDGFKAGYIYTMTLNVPSIEVSQTEIDVPAEGGTYDLTVTANVDYEVSVDADWITFTSDGDTYTFTVETTSSTEERTATITISGENITKEVTVTQEGAPLVVSSDEVTLAAKGETVSLTVTATEEYEVSTDADWLTLASDAASSSLTITASANDSTEPRSAVVTVAVGAYSLSVNVTQEGGYLTYSGESAFSFSPECNTLTISLKTNVGYTVSTSASWVCLSSTITSGTDNETLTFDVGTNENTVSRTATISIAWSDTVYEITVTQEGVYLEVSQTEFTVSADGSSSNYFTLSTNVDCAISVSDSWITVKKSNTKYYIVVDANESTDARAATVTIYWGSVISVTITVSQDGATSTEPGGIGDILIEEW